MQHTLNWEEVRWHLPAADHPPVPRYPKHSLSMALPPSTPSLILCSRLLASLPKNSDFCFVLFFLTRRTYISGNQVNQQEAEEESLEPKHGPPGDGR